MTAADVTAGDVTGADVIDDARADAAAERRRRVWGWVALVTALVVIGTALAFVATPEWRAKGTLDPESPGPDGALALARLLEDQGVRVEVAHSREDAERALTGGGTLVMGATRILDERALREVAAIADRTVLIDPSFRDAELFFDDGQYVGTGPGPVAPACELPEAERAGEIDPNRLYPAGSAETTCYPAPGGGYALLASEIDGTEIVLFDATTTFANRDLDSGGNAALGLNLLGAHETLVWYLPSPGDRTPGETPDTLGTLTPAWLSPAIVLLAATAVAAGIWRGRRFGPLVAEDLPVTVRGSETLEGRARLYQRAHDPAHAADLVRRGAVERMSRRLGLNRRASADEVAAAAALRLGTSREQLLAILHDQPTTDAALVAFGERLRDLEAAVNAAAHSEGNPS